MIPSGALETRNDRDDSMTRKQDQVIYVPMSVCISEYYFLPNEFFSRNKIRFHDDLTF